MTPLGSGEELPQCCLPLRPKVLKNLKVVKLGQKQTCGTLCVVNFTDAFCCSVKFFPIFVAMKGISNTYFGARYYTDNIMMWLSVDPMSDKYPSMSPYMYCAGNPIRLRDPNGMDFDPKVDHKNKTITICAVIYTANENKERAQESADMWNNQSGRFHYVDDNYGDYTIIFDLTVAEGDYRTYDDAYKASSNDFGSNLYDVVDVLIDRQGKEVNARGTTIENQCINVLPGSPKRTGGHEVGHILGCDERPDGLMESGGSCSEIMPDHVANILTTAGINVKNYDVRSQNTDNHTVTRRYVNNQGCGMQGNVYER